MNPFMVDPSHFNRIMPTRKTRRRITNRTLAFCAFLIGYIVVAGDSDNTLHQTALEYAFILAGTVALTYSMSAVADNAVVYNTKQEKVEEGQ